MTQRVQKAIDIFLDAINNGTLAKGSCKACAVGNLVRVGYIEKYGTEPNGIVHNAWSSIFVTNSRGQTNKISIYLQNSESFCGVFNNPGDPKTSVESTDFTVEELAAIEYAFETNTKISHENYWLYTKEEIRKDQIKGLEAVVKVMLSFENSNESVEEVFTKRADLIPI